MHRWCAISSCRAFHLVMNTAFLTPVALGLATALCTTGAVLAQRGMNEPPRERSPLGTYEQMSSDGSYALHAERQKRIVTVRNLRDGTSRVLLKGDESTNYGSLLWSRDGKQLAYGWCLTQLPAGRCGNPKTPPQTELRIINVDGTGMRVVLPRQSAGIDFYDWSADGGSILASIREGNTSRLGVVSVRDGSFVELKTGGDIGNAALSPDGRFVVYGNWQDAIAWGLKPFEIDVAVKNDIHVIEIEGGGERPLIEHPADEHFIGWTPAGSVLFTSDRSGTIDLWSAPFEGGRLTGPAYRLATDVGAIEPRAILANGDLHYDTARRDTYSGRMMRFGGAGARDTTARPILSRQGEHQGPLRFAPDGQRAAYLSGQDVFDTIVTTTLQSETLTRIPLSLPRNGNATDVATQVLLTNEQIYVLTGGSLARPRKQLNRVTPTSGALESLGEIGEEAALWPDGKSLAYVRGGPARVLRRAIDGKDETELFNAGTDGRARSLSVSPDGMQVAVFTGKAANSATYETGELRIVDTGSRESRTLATPRMRFDSVQRTTWSPDGKWVYYVTHPGEENAGEELWRVPAVGGTPEKVVSHECGIFGPAVHPSGAFLTFASECVSPEATYVLRGVIPADERTPRKARR